VKLGDSAGRDRGAAVDSPLGTSRDDLVAGRRNHHAPLFDRRDRVRADPGCNSSSSGGGASRPGRRRSMRRSLKARSAARRHPDVDDAVGDRWAWSWLTISAEQPRSRASSPISS
jgi:hypothetical protein